MATEELLVGGQRGLDALCRGLVCLGLGLGFPWARAGCQGQAGRESTHHCCSFYDLQHRPLPKSVSAHLTGTDVVLEIQLELVDHPTHARDTACEGQHSAQVLHARHASLEHNHTVSNPDTDVLCEYIGIVTECTLELRRKFRIGIALGADDDLVANRIRRSRSRRRELERGNGDRCDLKPGVGPIRNDSSLQWKRLSRGNRPMSWDPRYCSR